MIAFDLETYPIQPGILAPRPVSYSWSDGESVEVGLWEDCSIPEESLVGCNVAFDMAVMLRQGHDVWEKYQRNQITDISVRQQLIDIETGIGTKRSYSLKSLVKLHLGVDLEKEEVPRLRYHEVEAVPVSQWPKEFVDYAKADASLTWQVWSAQEALKSTNVKDWEHYECRAAFALHLMSVWGVRADGEHVRKLMLDTNVKFKQLRERFKAIGVLREDGSKDKKKLQELVTAAYGGNPPKTEKGGVSTSRLTLEESCDRVLQELTGDGPIEKIISTYGPVCEQAAKEVYHARYNVLVSSGRTSSNFQQWPRGGPNSPEEVTRLRASFVPRPGNVFVLADWVGCELITLAQVCINTVGFSKLAEALNSGQNLHTRLAARFAGIGYEEMKALVKAKDPQAVCLRQAAKPVNFGLPGLMGAQRLVLAAQKDGAHFCVLSGDAKECPGSSCKKCLRLAFKYKKLWELEWPEVGVYHNWVQRQNLSRFVSPLTGFVRGDIYPSEAANHPFQHLASRMAKTALWAVSKECYTWKQSPMYGFRPWLFAHDEIGIEGPKERFAAAGAQLAMVMREAPKVWVRDVAIAVEPVAMSRWFKGLDTKLDEKGNLCLSA